MNCTYCDRPVYRGDSQARDEEFNTVHANCRIRFLEADREAWKTMAELNRLKAEAHRAAVLNLMAERNRDHGMS